MKDFDSWNRNKKKLEETSRSFNFHEREIWWCSLGLNIGEEQDGKNQLFERPVLIIRKFNKQTCWVLPMSTIIKEGVYYYNMGHDGITFSVILSQLRIVSFKRFSRLIRKINHQEFSVIQDKLIDLIKPTKPVQQTEPPFGGSSGA